MSFVLLKIAGLVAHPSVVILTLVAIGAAFRWWLVTRLGVALLLAVVLLPLDDLAMRPLEDRFAPPPTLIRVDGVVVLGGAVDELVSPDRGTPSLTPAASRLVAMASLARTWPQATVIFAGGPGLVDPGPTVEADIVRDMLPALGLAPDRVLFDRRSRTTEQNAIESRKLVEPKPGQCWLLVTSAQHMPRGVAAFDAVGWPMTPWPVGYTTLRHRLTWIETPAARIGRLDAAAHEWIGWLVFRLRHPSLRRASAGPNAGCMERSTT